MAKVLNEGEVEKLQRGLHKKPADGVASENYKLREKLKRIKEQNGLLMQANDGLRREHDGQVKRAREAEETIESLRKDVKSIKTGQMFLFKALLPFARKVVLAEERVICKPCKGGEYRPDSEFAIDGKAWVNAEALIRFMIGNPPVHVALVNPTEGEKEKPEAIIVKPKSDMPEAPGHGTVEAWQGGPATVDAVKTG